MEGGVSPAWHVRISAFLRCPRFSPLELNRISPQRIIKATSHLPRWRQKLRGIRDWSEVAQRAAVRSIWGNTRRGQPPGVLSPAPQAESQEESWTAKSP